LVAFACVLQANLALAGDEDATDVNSSDCKGALAESEAKIQKLEDERDRFASHKKTFIILAGLIGALSSGIAAASPKPRRRLITSLLASLCGALTVASQWYDPSDSDKEELDAAKKQADARRALLIDGSDTLIDIKDEGNSQTVHCLERRALKQFTRCVSGPGIGKDPEACEKKSDTVPPATAAPPIASAAGLPTPSSHPTGAGGPRGAGGAVAAARTCTAAVRTVLSSKTTVIAGRIHEPAHGEISVLVRFGDGGAVQSVSHVGGNAAVLPTVDAAVRSGVQGEPNCEANVTYRW
jgi:hypothetical protein